MKKGLFFTGIICVSLPLLWGGSIGEKGPGLAGAALAAVEAGTAANNLPAIVRCGAKAGSYRIVADDVQSLPIGRNPLSLVTLVPGLTVLDNTVPAVISTGMTAQVMGAGAGPESTRFELDGTNITAAQSDGSSAAQFSFDNFEEIQVMTGGNDITVATGGVTLNMVTKHGGNQLQGGANFFVAPFGLGKSPSPEMEAAGLVYPKAGFSWEASFGLGGPIIKDKVWFFGSYGMRNGKKRTEAELNEKGSQFQGLVKLDYNLALKTGTLSGKLVADLDQNKLQGLPVFSPAQQDADSLWDKSRPASVFSGYTQLELAKFWGSLRLTSTGNKDTYDPRGSEINDANGHNQGKDWTYFLDENRLEGSALDYRSDRDSFNLAMDGNYFAEGVLGGDHEIRFGVDYYTANTTTQSLYPNQRALYVNSDSPAENLVKILPDVLFDVHFKRISFYLQDTITWGKLTASVGIRYDRESGGLNPVTLPPFTWYEPGSPYHDEKLYMKYFPPLQVKPFDIPAAWELISPRVALTYDISGDGKNVVKMAAGRYLADANLKTPYNYFPRRYGYAHWNDKNKDQIPQFPELSPYLFGTPLLYGEECQVTGLNPTGFDEDYSAPILDELTLTYEKAFGDDVAACLTGFYKKRHNLAFDTGSDGRDYPVRKGMMPNGKLETKDNWTSKIVTVGGKEVTVYERKQLPVGWYYHNLEDAYDRYLGLNIVLNKKLSDGWMANLSFTWQDWKRYRFAEETLDMNNFDFFNEGVVAPLGAGPADNGAFVNSNWQLQASGLYQTPWGIDITGFFMARQGYPQPLRSSVMLKQGPVYIYADPDSKLGDERLPIFWQLNLGLEKTLKINDRVNATLVIDWYNVTNNQIELMRNLNIGSEAPAAVQPVLWSNAGLFQFGVRVNF